MEKRKRRNYLDKSKNKESKDSKNNKMSKKNKIIIGVVSLVLVIFIILAFIFNKKGNSKVEMYTVSEQNPISFSGSSKAKENQEIYFDGTKGVIKEYYINDGQEVQKGQSLFSYENETIKEQVDKLDRSYKQAVNGYKNANKELNNAKKNLSDIDNTIVSISNKIDSYKPTIVNPTEMDSSANMSDIANLQMQLEQAQAGKKEMEMAIPQLEKATSDSKSAYEDIGAEIESMKKNINYVEKANVTGVAKLDKNAAKAGMSMTGATEAIVSIISNDIIVEGQVSEYDYNKIKSGDSVEIIVNSNDEKISGKVISVDSTPTAGNVMAAAGKDSGSSIPNYNFQVEPEKYIHYGFTVDIKLPQKDIFIPKEAVIKDGSKFFVYKVVDNKTVKEEIYIKETDGLYQLSSGLELGDKIISNITGITENIEVEVMEENIEPQDETKE